MANCESPSVIRNRPFTAACDYRDGTRCLFAERLLASMCGAAPCETNPDACERCVSLPAARCVNDATVGIAILAAGPQSPCAATLASHYVKNVLGPPSVPPPDGSGTELERIIATWFGVSDDPKCKCKSRVAEMNTRGVAWCEANIETIVGWLKEEAARRQLFFSKPVARQVVRLAIRRAKAKSKKPGWNGVP